MDELIAFVAARLDEDEAAAKAAAEQARYDEWDAVGDRTDDEIGRSNWRVVGVALMETHPGAMASAQHIARHDPARVLRDVAADRKLLAEWQKAEARSAGDDDRGYAGVADGLRLAVKIRAERFDCHPDYRQEWAP